MELVAGLVRQCGGGEILKMGEVDGLLRARHPVGRFALRPVRVQSCPSLATAIVRLRASLPSIMAERSSSASQREGGLS
jgi:hypothetical protein